MGISANISALSRDFTHEKECRRWHGYKGDLFTMPTSALVAVRGSIFSPRFKTHPLSFRNPADPTIGAGINR
jgi:hypothetical protein